MTKTILLIIFLLLLMLPVLTSGGQEVSLDLLIFGSERTFNLGSVMLLFAGYGMAAMGLFGLLDRMDLSLKNRKMKKQITLLEAEVSQLREIATLDQDPT